MAHPFDIVLAEARVFHHRLGCLIELGNRHTRPDGLDGGLLGSEIGVE